MTRNLTLARIVEEERVTFEPIINIPSGQSKAPITTSIRFAQYDERGTKLAEFEGTYDPTMGQVAYDNFDVLTRRFRLYGSALTPRGESLIQEIEQYIAGAEGNVQHSFFKPILTAAQKVKARFERE